MFLELFNYKTYIMRKSLYFKWGNNSQTSWWVSWKM